MTLRPIIRQHVAGTEVLVWDLDLAREIASHATGVLPAHEVVAALKARDPIVRSRRLTGRILVRRALSTWMNQGPEELVFEAGPHGKPFLPSGPAFNISHSGKYLALAVRSSGRVGIDIEVVRDSPDLPALARRYFTESEHREILRSQDGATQAFFRVWVRKEAFLKATGYGLALPLDSFSVSSATLPLGTNALTDINYPGENPGRWLVMSLVPPGNSQLALAVDYQGSWDSPWTTAK